MCSFCNKQVREDGMACYLSHDGEICIYSSQDIPGTTASLASLKARAVKKKISKDLANIQMLLTLPKSVITYLFFKI